MIASDLKWKCGHELQGSNIQCPASEVSSSGDTYSLPTVYIAAQASHIGKYETHKETHQCYEQFNRKR